MARWKNISEGIKILLSYIDDDDLEIEFLTNNISCADGIPEYNMSLDDAQAMKKLGWSFEDEFEYWEFLI